jgi:hypothetical protein
VADVDLKGMHFGPLRAEPRQLARTKVRQPRSEA